MSISVLVPVATSDLASSIILPAGLTEYQVTLPSTAGVYTLTTNNTSYQVTAKFYNASGVQQTVDTTSGTVTAQLNADYPGFFLRGASVTSNLVVTLTKIAENVDSYRNDTYGSNLTLVTSSSTYNTTGMLYVIAVGGGGGGSCYSSGAYGGAGGGSGGVSGGFTYVNTASNITVGTGGAGGTINTAAVDGGTTNFGNTITSNGGGRAGVPNANSKGNAGNGGGDGGQGGGGPITTQPGSEGAILNKRLRNGSTGGGGGGSNTGQPGGGTAYASGGFGVGGAGGSENAPGGNATGYGAGGGGGGRAGNNANRAGGSGSAGCVYILNGISL